MEKISSYTSSRTGIVFDLYRTTDSLIQVVRYKHQKPDKQVIKIPRNLSEQLELLKDMDHWYEALHRRLKEALTEERNIAVLYDEYVPLIIELNEKLEKLAERKETARFGAELRTIEQETESLLKNEEKLQPLKEEIDKCNHKIGALNVTVDLIEQRIETMDKANKIFLSEIWPTSKERKQLEQGKIKRAKRKIKKIIVKT